MSDQQAEVIETTAVVTPPPPPEKSSTQAIAVNSETQALAPANHSQLLRFIDAMITARSLPKHLTNREQVLSAWNFAAQLGFPPQPSLRNIAVIEGSPSLFGDLPLALVQRHKEFVFYEEFNIDENGKRISYENNNLKEKPWGGVVRLQRKGMKEPQSFSFSLVDAERAGLLRRAKEGMPWQAYQPVMLIRRARITAIRALFADALTGASIAEEFGHAPDLRDVTPQTNKADALNSWGKK
jgi:hypothetical protein